MALDLFAAVREAVEKLPDSSPHESHIITGGLSRYSAAPLPVDGIDLSLAIEPMPHQKVVAEAVRAGNRQILLADQMGVGKTLSAILCAEDQEAYPLLVICPPALKYNWEKECNRAVPHRTVKVLSGTQPDRGQVGVADITIVPDSILWSWTMVTNAATKKPEAVGPLVSPMWEALVIDECHVMKNAEAKRTRAAYGLAASLNSNAIRILMSGTPLLNRPAELVAPLSILGLLNPIFGGKSKFQNRYCNWEANRFGARITNGVRNAEELHQKLRDYCMIRRLRSEVLTLPNKGRTLLPVEMSADSQNKYKRALQNLQEFFRFKTGDMDYRVNAAAEAIMLLNALRQVSGEGKVDAAASLAEDLLNDNEPVFITTCHKEVVLQLSKRLLPWGVVTITGDDSSEAKQRAVDTFQSGGAQVCIGNITSAGVGFTLTRSANIIVAELPWTPGALQQVEDRLHRIGQHRNVTSTVLISQYEGGSVDERLWNLMDGKAGVINAVLDGEYTGLELNDEGSFQNQLLESFRSEI